MKLETVERMAADAESLKGTVTYYSGRNTVAAVFDKDTRTVAYKVNGWPVDEHTAGQILNALQSGLPVSLP